MNKVNIKNNIAEFLVVNGWKLLDEPRHFKNNGLYNYEKSDNIGISIDNEDVVFIGEEGDFLHIPLNLDTLFTMLGYMFHYRYISIDYKFPEELK